MKLKFEWDEEKATINLKKHKVAFEDARKANSIERSYYYEDNYF